MQFRRACCPSSSPCSGATLVGPTAPSGLGTGQAITPPSNWVWSPGETPSTELIFFVPPNQDPHTQLLQNICPTTMPIVGTAPSSEHCSHNRQPSSGQSLPGRDGDGDARAHVRSGRMTRTRVAHLAYRHSASHATKPTPYPTLAEEAPG
jgi:hypothetical protein